MPVAVIQALKTVAEFGMVLLLLCLVVVADRRPTPPRRVWAAVLLGALSGAAGFFVEDVLIAIALSSDPGPSNPALPYALQMLYFAAIPEETVKLAAIAAIALRSRVFREPMDGVVYGAAVGLGFAALENLAAIEDAARRGDPFWLIGLGRAMSAVPFHGASGTIFGAYIAKARFDGAIGTHRADRWRRAGSLLAVWLVLVLLHATRNTWWVSILSATSGSDLGDLEAMVLGLIGILGEPAIDLGTFVFAILLVRRTAIRQSARLRAEGLTPVPWRRTWGTCLLAIGFGVVGLRMLIVGDLATRATGTAIVAVAAVIARGCVMQIRKMTGMPDPPVNRAAS